MVAILEKSEHNVDFYPIVDFVEASPLRRNLKLKDEEGINEGEAAAERVSDDTEEMVTVLTSMDAASILTSGGVQVVPTAAEVASATVRNEKIVETDTPKKKKFQEQMNIQMARQLEEEMEKDAQKMNEHIARDAEVVRIHAEEELQMMINSLDMSNETVLKYLQEYE
nr:hypothetical protein [Tanacetum cinerariifolium]